MKEVVKEYYGQTLQGSADLQTDACCTQGDLPSYVKRILGKIHPEVLARYYGCGLVVPQLLQGARVLDLGCGAGQDCYALAQLVGESGSVLGVDMTPEQLAIAKKYEDYHREKFGYGESNVTFQEGHIEALDQLGLPAESFDVIVSNCVINLCPDKEAVLREAYRLLKVGGELYFSDVYSDRRVPEALIKDPLLYGECLSGALYWNDFHNLAKKVGFLDPRLVSDRPLAINNPIIQEKIGHIGFYSATYRLFKLPELEPACEDYGQAVVYKGTVPHSPQMFILDKHHAIATGKIFPVCGNSYRMLNQSRFAPHFEFFGNWEQHYGIFSGCGVDIPYDGRGVTGAPQGEKSGSCC